MSESQPFLLPAIDEAIIDNYETETGLTFDSQRREVLMSETSLDVQACPGSGKTTMVAAKLVLSAKLWPFSGRGICVLSHTNVAKNEIIDRLKKSADPRVGNLLGYPHFIGTIQDFIQRFVTYPFLRSIGISVSIIDDDICTQMMKQRAGWDARNYTDHQHDAEDYYRRTRLIAAEGDLNVSVHKLKNRDSTAYKALENAKCKLISEGIFHYSEMFEVAKAALSADNKLGAVIRKRFPVVIIDEMQDTSKLQDKLLQSIYPQNSTDCVVQRFGDPDQNIFRGTGNDIGNESYNGKSRDQMGIVIDSSHRFSADKAGRIAPLSVNRIALTGTAAEEGDPQYKDTVILYDDNSIERVVDRFAEIVADQFGRAALDLADLNVKAVGAVGKSIQNPEKDFCIPSYVPDFVKHVGAKNNSINKFIAAVFAAQKLGYTKPGEAFAFLQDSLLEALRSADINDPAGRPFSPRSLYDHLADNGQATRYRKLLAACVKNTKDTSEQGWERILSDLTKCLGAEWGEQLSEFMQYSDVTSATAVAPSLSNLRYYQNGVNVDISTIHSVKGETHDATLVLETKNYAEDIGKMMRYISASEDEVPAFSASGKRETGFSRSLYVGCSRPRHLLCIAVHVERACDYLDGLRARGWSIDHRLVQQDT